MYYSWWDNKFRFPWEKYRIIIWNWSICDFIKIFCIGKWKIQLYIQNLDGIQIQYFWLDGFLANLFLFFWRKSARNPSTQKYWICTPSKFWIYSWIIHLSMQNIFMKSQMLQFQMIIRYFSPKFIVSLRIIHFQNQNIPAYFKFSFTVHRIGFIC